MDTTSSSEPPAKRMKETKRVEMAFLGPRGTYGEQVRSAVTNRVRCKAYRHRQRGHLRLGIVIL